MVATAFDMPSDVAEAAPLHILVADDDREMGEILTAGLTQRGYAVTAVQSPDEALALLDSEDFAAMLVDIHMEGTSGLDLCRVVVGKRPDMPVVVMTGFGTLEHAVAAIRAGAFDFVTKPSTIDVFALALERSLKHRSISEELQRLRRRNDDDTLPGLIGSGGSMRRLARLVTRIAETDTNVLITGESGTGKELVARAIHERSGRKGPFLAINCAAVPETLLESELFGHERGAFTDARVAREGLFVEANNGTLFLDEIGEMPLSMQAKLLRALQERKVRPLGSSREVSFNARLVTATNRDLEAEVAAKRFREDLFYRVNVVRVDVPPLRDRGTDILELAEAFLERTAARSKKTAIRLTHAVAEKLMVYNWPGNVRELENCLERAAALCRQESLTLEDLPSKIRQYQPTEIFTSATDDPAHLPAMAEVEERYIRKVLHAVGNNKTLAAKVLGFDRRTLYRKLAALAHASNPR